MFVTSKNIDFLVETRYNFLVDLQFVFLFLILLLNLDLVQDTQNGCVALTEEQLVIWQFEKFKQCHFYDDF